VCRDDQCGKKWPLIASCGQGLSAELGRINPSLLAPHFSTPLAYRSWSFLIASEFPSNSSKHHSYMLRTLSRPSFKLYPRNISFTITIRALTMAPLKSWVSIPQDSHFSLSNIPFGIITSKNSQTEKRPAVAIGDHVLDLQAFASGDGFSALPSLHSHLPVFSQPTLNVFAALGQPVHREVRAYLQEVLSENTSHPKILKDNLSLQKSALLPKHETKTHLPMQIGDYTDFYAGVNHAFNAGCLFRGPANALQPNYYHIPIGYHGRASTVVVSVVPTANSS
jgi:hypothetical protein